MLKLSANLSMLFTEVELPLRFQLAKQHGFNAVEIQFPYSLSPDTFLELLTRQELTLVLFNVEVGDLFHNGEGLAAVPERQQQFREAIARAVDYARYVKPYAINILPGCCFNSKRLPDYVKTFRENLCYAADAFHPLGIKTVFEAINSHAMPGFLIDTGQGMLETLKAIDREDIFMQYDVYHALMMGDDPVDFISRHADKIGHIQFADCPGRGQPGTGRCDFSTLFTAIATSGYSRWLGAEYKPLGNTWESLDWMVKLP
jgi:hydroxypyruvate isomerase